MGYGRKLAPSILLEPSSLLELLGTGGTMGDQGEGSSEEASKRGAPPLFISGLFPVHSINI